MSEESPEIWDTWYQRHDGRLINLGALVDIIFEASGDDHCTDDGVGTPGECVVIGRTALLGCNENGFRRSRIALFSGDVRAAHREYEAITNRLTGHRLRGRGL